MKDGGDVSESIAAKVHEITRREGRELTSGTRAFIEAHSQPASYQQTLPLGRQTRAGLPMLWPLRNAPAVTREAEEDWGRQQMMDPWGRELFLICLLAAFSSELAWVAAAFAAAAIVAGSQARPR